MIAIPRDIVEELISHAKDELPAEACGMLGGKSSRVVESYRLTNTDASSEHFSMSPAEQFAAVKKMRAQGLEMLAIYHSHPSTPARMSDEDLRMALTPGIRHIIISLADAANPSVRGFVVNGGEPIEETIVVEEKHEFGTLHDSANCS